MQKIVWVCRNVYMVVYFHLHWWWWAVVDCAVLGCTGMNWAVLDCTRLYWAILDYTWRY